MSKKEMNRPKVISEKVANGKDDPASKMCKECEGATTKHLKEKTLKEKKEKTKK